VNWTNKERLADFFDLKGVVEGIAGRLGLVDVAYTPVYVPTWATQYHLEMRVDGRQVGVLASASDEVRSMYDLKEAVFFAEINWDVLAAAAPDVAGVKYRPISRFPGVDRDLAVLVDTTVQVGAAMTSIRAVAGGMLRRLTVFDEYRGDQVPAGKKSVAFGLRFSADRTLQDDEVDRMMARILDRLQNEQGAELRR
jgi:phenylalanyl-tRNA synthetase beta chain